MKRMNGMALAVVALGLLVTSGCVSKAEYDKALELNRNAQKQLENERAKANRLAAEQADMIAQRDNALRQADEKAKEASLMAKARRELQADYDTLRELYSRLRNEKKPTPIGITVLPKEVDQTLRQFAQENPELIEYFPNRGMVKIKSDLTFDSGSTNVKDVANAALKKFVTILNDQAIANYHVYIAGHTDDVPIRRPATKRKHPDNWYLSVHRAVSVQKAMVEAGLASERIGVMGFGEYHPAAPNKTSSSGKKLGNEANRRVEIWIVSPDRFLTGTQEPGK